MPMQKKPSSNEGHTLPQVFKVREVAKHLGVSPRTVYFWIDEGHLNAIRWGERGTRIREDALRAFLDANPLATERAA